MDDKTIVSLYLARNESAILQTDKKYGNYLMKIAYNILNDREDSKESVNDTYLAAWNSIPPNIPEMLSVYLSRIARRISIDIFRKKNSQKRKSSQLTYSLDEMSDCTSNTPEPDEIIENKRLSEVISAYLYSISELQRNIFICRYYYFDSVKDIAKYCNITESNVKTTLYRLRNGLREYLLKEGFSI